MDKLTVVVTDDQKREFMRMVEFDVQRAIFKKLITEEQGKRIRQYKEFMMDRMIDDGLLDGNSIQKLIKKMREALKLAIRKPSESNSPTLLQIKPPYFSDSPSPYRR